MLGKDKQSPLKIADEVIRPGERVSLAVPLPQLFSCAPVYMPVKVIHGKKPGPCLLITAAMHGDEVNGTDIINRLLKHSALKHVHGTLIAVPVVNVYGLMTRSRFLPDGAVLDRHFPGSEHGSLAGRVCHLINELLVSQADYCIDLQTGQQNHTNLPQVHGFLASEQCKALAKTFLTPVICDVDITPGSFREAAQTQDIPLLVYEAGEAMRFNENAIKVGVRGIINVMRSLNMLREAPVFPTKLKQFIAQESHWIRAPASGVVRLKKKLGEAVQKGDELAVISDPFGSGVDQSIKADNDGVIVGQNNLPLVNEGETLMQLAGFRQLEQAATHLEEWHENKESFTQIGAQ